MSEPSSARHSVGEEGIRPGANSDPLLVDPSGRQLRLDLGDDWTEKTAREGSAAPEPAWEQKKSTLFSELKQARSLIQDQIERINNLEQALDQSLTCVAEMRIQLADQQFLENQLASTEEIANIQQQAITQLKRQLAQQQSDLETQHHQSQAQNQFFQELLTIIEELAQGQQTKLGQLRTQIYADSVMPTAHGAEALAETISIDPHLLTLQDAVDLPEPFLDPNAPPLAIALPPSELPAATATDLSQADAALQALWKTLSDRDAAIHQLETELNRAHIALQEQQALIDSLQLAYAVRQGIDSPFDSELFSAHCKIQDLETQLSKQSTAQAMLQHAYQELEQTRDSYQVRLTDLEQHRADMQEQILKQAQQASEYEAAVQHWKDRYHNSKDCLLQLTQMIERSQPHLFSELSELLTAIHSVTLDTTDADTLASPAASPSNRGFQKDLPDFLARRQRYRGTTKPLLPREKSPPASTKID